MDNGGLLVRRDLPTLGRSLDHALARGVLTRLAPGVLCATSLKDDLSTRARAVMAVDPHATIVGRGAAALGWWPELDVRALTAAAPQRAHTRQPGIAWHKRRLPPELVVEVDGVRFASPALSVLDLTPELGGQPIDEALRRGAVTLDDLQAALTLTPNRRGNAARAWLLADSRDIPWSPLERVFQRRFRALELPYAHATNVRVTLPDGSIHAIDLAIPDLLLGFEVDGWEFHHTKEAFDRDRSQGLALGALGWQIERISGDAVTHRLDDVMGQVAAVVRHRDALFRGTRPAGTRRRSSTRRGGDSAVDHARDPA